MRTCRSLAVVTASLLTLVTVQPFNAALAHATHGILIGHHHVQTPPPPPPPQSNPTVNVKDFGAKGDGSTDDTTSIQNAVASAQSQQKGVFFPAGTYLHNETITFGSVAVTGAGSASVLLAGDPKNTAIILTGASPSIQNIVISSNGLAAPKGVVGFQPSTATVLVQNATGFTVSRDTLVQGNDRFGVFVQRSSIGTVSSVSFNGIGSQKNYGVVIDTCFNTSVVGNLFQNESIGVLILPFSGLLSNGFGSQFIAVMNNTIGNVTFPTLHAGIVDYNSNTLSIEQNIVQMANSLGGTYAMFLTSDDNVFVSQNQSYGGWIGLAGLSLFNNGANSLTQNFVRNTGSSGIALVAAPSPSSMMIQSNQFGECGSLDSSSNSAVISVQGSKPNVAAVQIMKNSYQGHVNLLKNYVYAPNVPPASISGNAQSQTTLPGVPNN